MKAPIKKYFINLIICFFLWLIRFVNLSIGQSDAQECELMKLYQTFLLNENRISDPEKKLLNIEAIYYDNKRRLQKLMDHVVNVKLGNNPRLAQISTSIESKLANLFDMDLHNYVPKLVQICAIHRFVEQIVNKMDKFEMITDPVWARVRDAVREPIALNIPLDSLDCLNPEMAETVLQTFSASPLVEQIHANSIFELTKKFPEFSQFIKENASKFPGINNFVELNDDERIKLYQQILNPKNKVELQMESELKLSLKMLFDELNRKYEIGDMQSSMMHVLVDLKILEALLDTPLQLMSLFLVRYNQIMDDVLKNQEGKWQKEKNIFEFTPKESFIMQREMLKDLHFEFLAKHIAKSDFNDEFVAMLRNLPGTNLLLCNLIGDTPRLVTLWESAEVREKLMDKKFFSDKMHLLEHYSGALASSTMDSKLANKFSADISVFMAHLDSVEFPIPNVVWVFFRLSYDHCQVAWEHINFSAFSHILHNVILKVDGLCGKTFYGKNKIQKEQCKLEKFVRDQMDLQSVELNTMLINQNFWVDDLVDLVKNYHFEALNKFVDHQMDDESVGKFLTFLGVLRESKKHRKNLLQFLDLNQIEQFFVSNGLKFNQHDFQAEMAKSKQKVGGKTIIVDSPGSSGSRKGGENKKKKENKKKGKA